MANLIDLVINANSKKAIGSLNQAKDSVKATRTEIGLMIGVLGGMVTTLNKVTKYSDEYANSMKVLSTTLGNVTNTATKFVSKMNEMTGLDETTLTRQVAKFSQLGKSLSLTSKNAEVFAEDLTTLSVKLALLYGTDYSVMANNVQKAIQGTQTTLKTATGIYANEVSEQATLMEAGIDRQVSSLNKAEQSIVRYATILRQVSNDNNLYQESVNSLAWQKQILTAQVKRLATAIGQVLTPVATRLLTVLNAILMVITEIIRAFAKLIGANVKSSENVGSVADGYDDLGASISGASAKAKKSLRAFDKLNNITTPTTGGAGGGGGLSVDPSILGLLGSASNQLDAIRTKASEIRDKIMEWLGFTQDTNGEWKFSKVTIGGVITTALILLGVFEKIYGLVKLIGSYAIWENLAKTPALFGIVSSVGQIGQGIALWAGGAGTFAEALSQFILPALVSIGKKFGGIFFIATSILDGIKNIKDINKEGWNIDNVIGLIKDVGLAIAGISLMIGFIPRNNCWWISCNWWFISKMDI